MLSLLFALLLAQLAVDVEREVNYAPPENEVRRKLDVYRPKGEAAARAAIIFFHGGGWRGGDKRQFAWYAEDAASQGYVAFAANYRLAPQHRYPAAVDDAQRVVRWVRANAARYGVDLKRVAAVGSSAGGHLAAMLGTRETRDNSDPLLTKFSSRVTCVVDYFGPTDLTNLGGSSAGETGLLFEFLGKSHHNAPELWADASPLTHVSPQSAPLLAIHGTADTSVPLSQSEALVEKLKKAGVEANLLKFEGAAHGFHNRRETEDARRAWRAALDFLSRCLK